VPSTPTSARSRSPSISSLETIEDVPEVEEAAVELDRDKLRGGGTGGVLRRNSHEDPRGRMGVALGMGVPPGWGGGGVGGGRGDKVGGGKKRWSVCGAEKRGDLDLETIWED